MNNQIWLSSKSEGGGGGVGRVRAKRKIKAVICDSIAFILNKKKIIFKATPVRNECMHKTVYKKYLSSL